MLSRMREEVAGMEAGHFASDAMAKDLGPMFDQALGVNTLGGNMCACMCMLKLPGHVSGTPCAR